MSTEAINQLAAVVLKARTKAATAKKKADDADREFRELQEQLREAITGNKLQSVRVKGFNFTPGERDILETYDWDAYWEWARKDKLGVYVERRPAKKAVTEQLAAGNKVPGVRPGTVPVLHISTAKK